METENTPATPEPTPDNNQPTWYIDENTPGVGDRPTWLPPKYQRLSDVEKARSELEKKLGGFTGAPENYNIESLEIDPTDPTIQALAEVGKKHNMNQEIFQEVVGRLVSIQDTQQEMYLDEQVKQLGKDGERMLIEFKNWTKDYLPAAEQEVVKDMVRTADQLKTFNKIMAYTHMSQVPTTASMSIANGFEGVQSLRAELVKNKEKFDNDSTYRKDWQSRMARAVTRENS